MAEIKKGTGIKPQSQFRTFAGRQFHECVHRVLQWKSNLKTRRNRLNQGLYGETSQLKKKHTSE